MSTDSPVASTTTSLAEVTSTTIDTGDVQGFAIGTIQVGDREFRVAVADERALRLRGLMGVEDLGDLDGMLFIMDGMVQNGFTMRNTLIPLHIAFFDEAGVLVDVLEMMPCSEEPCPSYVPDGRYRYTVEVPLGEFEGIDESATLLVKA
jgi:uncharacterized membrane protein (UPF0127 family)